MVTTVPDAVSKVKVVPQGFNGGRVADGHLSAEPGAAGRVRQRAELELLSQVFKTDAQLSKWPDR